MATYGEHERFADETDRYLDKHGVYDLFSSLLQQLVLEKPADPLSHLLAQLEKPASQTHIVLDGCPRETRMEVARQLAETQNLVHINLPNLLELEMKEQKTGQRFINTYVSERKVPPIDLVIPLLRLRLRKSDCLERGWILTDFPSSEEEAFALHQAGLLVSNFISLDCNDQEIQTHLEEVAIAHSDEKIPLLASAQLPRTITAFKNDTRLLRKFFGAATSVVDAKRNLSRIHADVQTIVSKPAVSLAPSRPKKICLLGIRGAGKATQATRLSRKYGLVHVSLGELLRNEKKVVSTLYQRASQYLDQHMPVPDDVVVSLVAERLARDDCKKQGWILDGVPRTPEQAAALSKVGICPSRVVFLDITADSATSRVEPLRVHPTTGHVYDIQRAPPSNPSVRDRLVQRPADRAQNRARADEQVIMTMHTLRTYYSDYAITVNGDQDEDAVFRSIETFLLAPLHRTVGQQQ